MPLSFLEYVPLHLPFLGIGICLVGCGIYFKRRRAKGEGRKNN